MKRVVYRRLVLRGFGCYKGAKTLDLSEGLNVYVADNEEGKSTLVAGLLAVLFGLPGSNNPSGFSKARYRNWDGADSFSGELQFSVEGQVYRLRRNLVTDRINLERQDYNSWTELAGGEHKVNARRPNQTYYEAITDLIGVINFDLFTSTFCVTQPQDHNPVLDNEVLRLVSGATGGYQRALDRLLQQFACISKQTGDMGLSTRNQTKDRVLDHIEKDIRKLKLKIEETRSLLDALPLIQAELVRQTEEKQRLNSLLNQSGSALRAWGEWRALRTRYRTSLAEQVRLQQALERVVGLEARLDAMRRALQASYPEMHAMPPSTGDCLKTLAGLRARIEEKQKEMAQSVCKLEIYREQINQLQDRLKVEFAPVKGRPDLPRQQAELLLLMRQQEELRTRINQAAREEQYARERLAGLWHWDIVSPAPSGVLPGLKRSARDLYRELEHYQNNLTKLDKLESELANRFGSFERAPAEALEACRDYPIRRDNLSWRLQRTLEAQAQARSAIRSHQQAVQKWREEFGPLTEAGENCTAFQDKQSLIVRKRQLEKELASNPVPTRPKWLVISEFLLNILVITVSSVFFPRLGFSIAAGLLLWAMIRYHRNRVLIKARNSLQHQINKAESDLKDLDDKHPFLAGLDEVQLIRAEERHRLCLIRKRDLDALEMELPQSDKLDALEKEVARLSRQIKQLDADTAEIRRDFEDPSYGYEQWCRIRRAKEETEREIASWKAREFRQTGTMEADPANHPLEQAAGRWRYLARLAEAAGVSCKTVADLQSWLGGLDEEWWTLAATQASLWEQAVSDLAKTQAAQAELARPGLNGMTRLASLDTAIRSLREQIWPFNEDTSQETLKEMIEECRTLQTEMETVGLLSQEEQTRCDRLRKDMAQLTEEADSIALSLQPVLSASGDDIERAILRWQQYCEQSDRLVEESSNLAAILQAIPVESHEELRLKSLDASNRANQNLCDWERLVAANPGLPDAGSSGSDEAAYRVLAAEVEKITDQINVVDQAIDDLRVRQTEILGSSPPNLAELEERLEQMELHRLRLQLEREALALAHNELSAAARDYQVSHRQHLQDHVTNHFRALSGVNSRKVLIDENFHLSLQLASGAKASVTQLSQGAQDQLYLAVRLAVADLLSQDLVLPFIFDDPFLNYDNRRLENLRQAVLRISKDRQVLLLSHRADYCQWQ